MKIIVDAMGGDNAPLEIVRVRWTPTGTMGWRSFWWAGRRRC